jgi:DNA transformation protein and related proteins
LADKVSVRGSNERFDGKRTSEALFSQFISVVSHFAILCKQLKRTKAVHIMKKQNSFVTYILEKLTPHGPIKARAMFGGYGIYYHDVMFASIVEDRLYFRVDAFNREDFTPYGSEPFIYRGMKKPLTLPYLNLPEDILENPQELPLWIQKARQAALRSKKVVKPPVKAPL